MIPQLLVDEHGGGNDDDVHDNKGHIAHPLHPSAEVRWVLVAPNIGCKNEDAKEDC